jgi:hypothetical protein
MSALAEGNRDVKNKLSMESGFSQVIVHPMTFGVATVFCGVAKE